MMNNLIKECVDTFGISPEIALKIITSIDVSKLKGYTGGEAASRFADYLGFLRIPDNHVSHEFFANRWIDTKVWIDVTEDLKAYLNNVTPLFTQSRLEPVLRKTPFYDAGLTKVLPGTNYNPEDGSALRKAPPLDESYSNFIIHEYLPTCFFLEVPNVDVHHILVEGLPKLTGTVERKVYITEADARASLSQDLVASGVHHVTRTHLTGYTLLSLLTDEMHMDNSVFYTKTITGHKGQGSNFGYFYSGSVPPRGCSVAKTNITE